MATRIARASLSARLTRLSSEKTSLHSFSRQGSSISPFILKTRSFGTSLACRATHYDALGLPRGANKREIKSAFYKLSKELHPDRNPDADQASKEKYLKASEAYATLVDDRKRRAYDRSMEPAASSHAPTHGTASHHHWSHHADLSRRSRANYAWDLPRRPRATASPRPQSHTHTHPHRAHQYTSGKAYHYPNARRTTANPNSAGSRAETEYERYLAAEERVRKDSGFVRTLQVAGLITAVAAVAGLARG